MAFSHFHDTTVNNSGLIILLPGLNKISPYLFAIYINCFSKVICLAKSIIVQII